MIKKNKKTLLSLAMFSLFIVITPITANAIQIELGGSLSTTVMRVSEESKDSSSGDAVAVMATKASYVPYFSLVGDERYFTPNTNFGWNYQVWGSSFEVDQQEVNNRISNEFGTRMSGFYFYATPLVFYRFGDRVARKPDSKWSLTLAMGYGVSYIDMEGNIRLTESRSDTTAETKDINISSLYYSFGLLARMTYKKFFFSISNNAPQARDYHSGLIFRLHNISYSLGYAFSFDFEFDDLTK